MVFPTLSADTTFHLGALAKSKRGQRGEKLRNLFCNQCQCQRPHLQHPCSCSQRCAVARCIPLDPASAAHHQRRLFPHLFRRAKEF